jgi:hypothetical protein
MENPFFVVSAGMILLFNVFAVGLYMYHISILSEINVADSIAQTQQKLVKVYNSYLQSGRILLLQTPFYCTFWYSIDLVQNAGIQFWVINISVVTLLTGFAIYLYQNLSIHNQSAFWQRMIAKHFGATKLQKALDIIKEVEG